MSTFSGYLCLGGLCICLILLIALCVDYGNFKNKHKLYKQNLELRINNIWKRLKNHDNRLVRLGSLKRDGSITPGWEDSDNLTKLKEKDVR